MVKLFVLFMLFGVGFVMLVAYMVQLLTEYAEYLARLAGGN